MTVRTINVVHQKNNKLNIRHGVNKVKCENFDSETNLKKLRLMPDYHFSY